MNKAIQALGGIPMFAYRSIRWRAWNWLPGYLWRHQAFNLGKIGADSPVDVMVIIADHFEPIRFLGKDNNMGPVREGVASWCRDYEKLAGRFRDSDGRPPQYSWFYAFDFPDFECLNILSRSSFQGFGEIEFHLHHGHDTHETFAAKLRDGLQWSNQAGAMISAEKDPRRSFAYIAGDWALDNGAGDDSKSGCNTEIGALRDAGCYADFTFPALGSAAQPRKTNAIYYATDCPKPKSYDRGNDIQVGVPSSGDLLMFQGPLVVHWPTGRFDDGSLESCSPPSPARLDPWLKAHVHVKGRPEWVFVKLFTHGIQNRHVVLGPKMEELLEGMAQSWARPPFRLHFVTAREACNIARAAEAGHAGNPNDFRDFMIPPPANRHVWCSSPWRLHSCSPERIHLEVLSPGPVAVEFAQGPLKSVRGNVQALDAHFCDGQVRSLLVKGDPRPEVVTRPASQIPPGKNGDNQPVFREVNLLCVPAQAASKNGHPNGAKDASHFSSPRSQRLPLKAVLCVVPYFPPDAQSGTHRTRALARYLPEHGWQPIVVAPRPEPGTAQDPLLLQSLPESLVVYRTPAPQLIASASRFWACLKGMLGSQRATANAPGEPEEGAQNGSIEGWVDWCSWWLQVPDSKIGWLPFALRAGKRAIRKHRCKAIYSSAPVWTAHLIGLLLKRSTGLPWVADFRDPWRVSPFRKIPYKSVDGFDAWLARSVVSGADWVICNTEPMRRNFIARYPHLEAKFKTVPNGLDPQDYVDLKPRRPPHAKKIVVTHAGNFYGLRRPDAIMKALGLLRAQHALGNDVCLQLLGPPDYEGKPLRAIAAEYGVEDMVIVQGLVPHRKALELMRGSDILLVAGFDGPGADLQIPAKLFEYLGVGQPILALAPKDSAIADLLERCGNPAEPCAPENPQEIASAILRLLARRQANSVDGRATRNGSIKQFYRREQVGQIAELLAECG